LADTIERGLEANPILASRIGRWVIGTLAVLFLFVPLVSSNQYYVHSVLAKVCIYTIVIAGLDLRAGDEILTTDEEHPGLLAPLGRARRRDGVTVKVVPFSELPAEVSDATRLIACSHVSWVGGKIVDTEALAATGVPVLLDAAQPDRVLARSPQDAHADQKHIFQPEHADAFEQILVVARLRERTIKPLAKLRVVRQGAEKARIDQRIHHLWITRQRVGEPGRDTEH